MAVRIAAMADLHCTKNPQDVVERAMANLQGVADVLVLCGDLTDYGLPDEARLLARQLAAVRLPMVGVLGNHDFESGKHEEVVQILTDAGVTILDGDAIEVRGVGFAGAKGFAGGFGERMLGPWGEAGIKRFVHEAIDEALKLEAALARLRTPQRIALLHYAPIRDTVEGEPLEIYPYLGSSRLVEPLNRYAVTAVFHGHAHRGAPEGKTGEGVPVYNVSLPLLLRRFPDGPPCRVIEVPVAEAAAAPAAPLRL